MTIQQAYKQLMYQLFELYDDREAANISDWTIEHITGQRKIERVTNKEFPFSAYQQQLLNDYSVELLQHKPVQYVLHEAWFAGMKLYVDENVLIPRPETEELVQWVVEEVTGYRPQAAGMLDIGTGSGCIAIALKKKLPFIEIHAADISADALKVAEKNASLHQTAIIFHQSDILKKEDWNLFTQFDIIVSNPPYVKGSEAKAMKDNVLKYEPHQALFVSDDDALIFYKAMAAFGKQHLKPGGKLFVEINEALGNEVLHLLTHAGYKEIEIKKDMQGKERMIKAKMSDV